MSAASADFIAAASFAASGTVSPGFFGASTRTTRLPLAHSFATWLTSSSVTAGRKRCTRPYSYVMPGVGSFCVNARMNSAARSADSSLSRSANALS